MTILRDLIPQNADIKVTSEYMDQLLKIGQLAVYKKLRAIKAGYHYISEEKIYDFVKSRGLERASKLHAKELLSFSASLLKYGRAPGCYEWHINIKGPASFWGTTAYKYKSSLDLTRIDKSKEIIPPSNLQVVTNVPRDLFNGIYVVTYRFEAKQPDPMIAGIIDDVPGMFYITQWDNDITLDDLI